MASLQSDVRRYVIWRDGGVCVFCGTKRDLTVHHIRPLRIGGANSPSNLVTLCNCCHRVIENGLQRCTSWFLPLIVWFVYGPCFWWRVWLVSRFCKGTPKPCRRLVRPS